MTTEISRRSWQGWQAFCDTPYLQRPDLKTAPELADMEEDALEEYQKLRIRYHTFMTPVETAFLKEIRQVVQLVRATNPVGGYAARNAVVIDGAPTVGKTTAINHVARAVDRRSRRLNGDRTATGAHRIPTARIGLSGSPSIKAFSRSIATFLGVPEGLNLTTERWTAAAMGALEKAETELLIVDDLHCLNAGSRDGQALTDHLKRILDDFAGTCVYAGVDLADKGLYDTSGRRTRGRIDQTARRWTLVRGDRISLADAEGRKEWKSLVATLESQLALCNHEYGYLASHADLLYECTTGSVGSLTELLKRAAAIAIVSGAERVDEGVIDQTPLDIGAVAARRAAAGEQRARKGKAAKGKRRGA
ncbi:TniB family NTP-binding protein [Dietzia sp. KRD202]|uniref:TniB family NTP-binding protein n=1 Tax=Dietzia sp. KRD202 TaxID=2729732 RepID=UPI0019D0F17A|nr:TniB family NTP-binding protein [Dietzia sp. KRD202]